jgi:hypothetical protein
MKVSKSGIQVLSENEVIVSLFRQVTRNFKFQGRWIVDDDLVASIRTIFAVDSNLFSFDASNVNSAIKKDKIFKVAGDFWKDHHHPNIFNFFKSVYKLKKKVVMLYYFSEEGKAPNVPCPTGTMLKEWIATNGFMLRKSSDRNESVALTRNDDLDEFIVHAHTATMDAAIATGAGTGADTVGAIDAVDEKELSPVPSSPNEVPLVVTQTPAKRPCQNPEECLRATKKQLFGAVVKEQVAYTPITSACIALDVKRSKELLDKLQQDGATVDIKWNADSIGSECWTVNRRVVATARILNTLSFCGTSTGKVSFW